MQTYILPQKNQWLKLCQRPIFETADLDLPVAKIMEDVRIRKDEALFNYSKKFDNCSLENLIVTTQEFTNAQKKISKELKEAIEIAAQNIKFFHKNYLEKTNRIQTMQGVECWRRNVAIEKVGLYIPGGSAPLFSTVLMLAIPAKIAQCPEVILCTPPSPTGEIHPAILYTAQLTGITKVYKVGGAQAIAAMTFGTESIPPVYKIFGPGNQFVTKAKEQAQQRGVAIDMPAGPSEVLVIADVTAEPSFVAADLLSQAEHGSDSQAILLCESKEFLQKVKKEIKKQLSSLPRRAIAEQALKNSRLIVLKNIDNCIELSNLYAPEHLIIATKNADKLADKITNAGSVFIGNYSCESIGDYASGTNHTLPTNGYARNYSGVSVESFIKKISFQKINANGLKSIGKAVEIMAAAEGLEAHKNAVTIRLQNLNNKTK